MSYSTWYQNVVKKIQPTSELQLYVRVLIFGLVVFGLAYFYTTSLKIPNALNKAVADASIILIGLSMLLSSVCYFWNVFDSKIIYRKQLGLIGFAFGVVHIALSFSSLQRLFTVEVWQQSAYWPALTGFIAAVIFTIMTLISNRYAAIHLGGQLWRAILRTGYIGMLFVLGHVVLLRSARWISWYEGGMKTLPTLSMVVSVFVIFVVIMRLLLWWSLKRNGHRK